MKKFLQNIVKLKKISFPVRVRVRVTLYTDHLMKLTNLAGYLQFVEMLLLDDHKFKNSSGNLTCNDSILEEQGQPAETLILQCSNCNTIIGDTTAWESSDPILRIIGLKRMLCLFNFMKY